jgi:glycosyltransferase involved in cell wall biosynthesis
MKVAFFSDTFLPFITGVSVAVWDLGRALADRGHEIHLIVPIPKGCRYEYPNVRLLTVKSIPAGFIYPGFRLAYPFNSRVHGYADEHRFDIIHYHTPLLMGRLAMAVSSRLKLPLIGTYHTSVDSREYRAHWKMHHGLFDRVMKHYIDFFYRRCDLVSVPTTAYADEVEALGLRYPTRVISNGIDLRKFPEVDAKGIKERFPGKIVLSVGRIAKEKNLQFLLEAWRFLQDEAQLLIIGGGPQELELRDSARQAGLRNVHFLGMIPHEELILSGYHRAADVFVMTSMVETQGLALMEAQAAGLPSVGINSGGTKDLIVDGTNGFLVKPGDQEAFVKATRSLIRDDTLRNRMRDATLMQIQRHDIKNVAKEWEEVYEGLRSRR